jgi:hypothetical protein
MATEHPPRVSDEDLLWLIIAIVKTYRNEMGRPVPASSGICAAALFLQDGISMARVGRITGLPVYTVSKVMRGLERDGITTLRRSDDNRRTVRCFITPRGRRVRTKVLRAGGAVVNAARKRALAAVQ